MDLTRRPPRSPQDKLGGAAWLPRAIDKGRAKLAGTLGEYNFDCPMDKILFGHLGIDAEAFLSALETRKTDAEMLEWVRANASSFDDEAISRSNEHLLGHGPSAQSQAYFDQTLERVAPGRKDIKTWAALIALEEGHVPATAR